MKKVLLLGLLVITMFLFMGCEDDATDPEANATLYVQSIPVGATIILDGQPTRTITPATIEIDPGSHTLRLEMIGFQDYSEDFSVAEDGYYEIFAIMMPVLNTTLIVNTDPSGATVYIDGAYTGYTTPVTLTNILPGAHIVRIYKPGFNEINAYVYIEENLPYTISQTLIYPIPPYPEFTLYNPYDGQHFSDNVINVYGYVELDTGSSFTGETVILSINGIDSELDVDFWGEFAATISIAAGANDLQLRANGPNGDTGVSDIITVYGDFTAPEIEVVLWWNSPTADLDLHVWNPAGEHCYYGNRTISDGFLDIDDTEGYGPETFAAEDANVGVYEVQVNCYGLDIDDYSDASLQVFFDGALAANYGPHHFITEDGNGTDPAAWWEACTITVQNGRCIISNDRPAIQVQEKIEFDKTNLPVK